MALAVLAAIGIAACGGSNDSSESTADMAASPAPVEAIAGGEFEEGGAEEPASETGGVASSGLPVALEDRQLITSVGLTMSTSDVRQAAADIRRVAASSDGIVFSSDVFLDDVQEDGSVPGGGQIVIKVPPADLDRLVTDLDGIGVVTRLSQNAEDVTDQLVDLDIRIRQAEAGIARIEVLLEDTTALDDVFTIENELNERQVDLERLRAAERNTDNLVAFATLTVQIDYRTPSALEEIVEPDDGIADAFADGWNAFVGAIFAIGYVLAVTAPFLLTGLLVLMLAWLLGRGWNRRQVAAREQLRLDADLRGDALVGSMPHPFPGNPPPPVAAQRVPDVDATAAADEPDGDTLVEDVDSPDA